MNPVIEGYISYSDLKNGTLNLYDLYLLNEVIEYKNKLSDERQRSLQRQMALNRKKGKHG
jgi:hypothetical protein